MCGIAGIYNLNHQLVDKNILIRMSDAIKHRGPNDVGFYLNKNLGFGHRRLSIIDLSTAGHQPMSNEDGSIWLIFNGEIYNYLELIPELKLKGHIFKSHTDSEVIIHAYEEYGEKCLNKFNGMWAFALWDNANKKLFCSRDRFGVKPFYYYYNNNQLIFSSEIKALFLHPEIKKVPNMRIIFDYLSYGFTDHTEQTFFKGIQQLRGSHYLTVNKNGLKITKYWDLHERNDITINNDNGYSQKFYRLFEDSIRLRLRSDVPIGTCLSGGLDSSSIVCIVNKLLKEEGIKNLGKYQKTFTSCFAEKKYDERQFSQSVIKQTGAEENLTFPKSENLFNEMQKIVWHQDEPFGSTSIFAQWCVMKLANKKNIKVLLDGQGGDELLGGYEGYKSSFFANLLKQFKIISLLKEINNFGIKSIAPLLPGILFYFLPRPLSNNLFHYFNRDNNRYLDNKFKLNYYHSVEHYKKFNNIFNNHLYENLIYYALPQLLHYEDRNSMAFSIEARVPFLDYRLVEFMFSIPSNQKIGSGYTKVVLRNAMKGIIPELIRKRRDKMGFVTPEDIWFRGILKKQIYSILNSFSFKKRGIFNVDQINKEFKLYCENKKNSGFIIWRWINLELWFNKFID